MNEYLKHMAAAHNTRASITIGKLALVIPCYRTDQLYIVPVCCCASVELAAIERV